MDCFGFVEVDCESGDTRGLTVSSMGGVFSQDDAGNRVVDSPTVMMYCDSEAPELSLTDCPNKKVVVNDNIYITNIVLCIVWILFLISDLKLQIYRIH